ncbi:MAG: glycosyltransferase family 4 protein [Chloroflexi bacterium]|nr:glycosyltransferase family 4 protein [Chloroflexota bacterium]
MNVLLIDHAPFFGGSESFLLDLVTRLDRATYSPLIVTDKASPVLDRLQPPGVPLLTTSFPRINRSPVFFWRLFRSGWQLAGLARAARADLMHTFTARTHLIGAVASRLSGIPLVWRIGDDTLPAGIMALFGRAPRRIVAVSDWIRTQYPRLRFDGLVPDGARLPLAMTREAARAELGLPADALVVAHVGRLVRWKGQAVFIRALAQAAQTVPNVHGLIVGTWHAEDAQSGLLGGGEAYYRELRELAIAMGLNSPQTERAHFAGFIPDPGAAYAAADVFIHSSTLPEPFGRTIIEAMMAGCPVIAARAGGPAEIIVDGQSGLLTSPADVDALAAALIDLLTSPQRRAQLGQAGRQRAEAEYSLSIMTQRMTATYQAALAAP